MARNEWEIRNMGDIEERWEKLETYKLRHIVDECKIWPGCTEVKHAFIINTTNFT